MSITSPGHLECSQNIRVTRGSFQGTEASARIDKTAPGQQDVRLRGEEQTGDRGGGRLAGSPGARRVPEGPRRHLSHWHRQSGRGVGTEGPVCADWARAGSLGGCRREEAGA